MNTLINYILNEYNSQSNSCADMTSPFRHDRNISLMDQAEEPESQLKALYNLVIATSTSLAAFQQETKGYFTTIMANLQNASAPSPHPIPSPTVLTTPVVESTVNQFPTFTLPQISSLRNFWVDGTKSISAMRLWDAEKSKKDKAYEKKYNDFFPICNEIEHRGGLTPFCEYYEVDSRKYKRMK